jgi:subtilase family serine protease
MFGSIDRSNLRGSKSLRQRSRGILKLEELEDRMLLSVFTPAQIRHAYGFDQITFSANGTTIAGDGSGQTIAIVDAYDDPNIQSDLAHFDQTFNLPNPVLVKANPQGKLPAADPGWAEEISLDVEWAHAIAPGAKILLVEANSSSLADLLAAVDYARRQPGVSAVSMSWGGSEFPQETLFDSYFTTPVGHNGVTFVASSGDSGAWYGPEWPATSPNVLSVGGTSLYVLNSSGTFGGESAWTFSTGGFSSFEREPAFQLNVQRTFARTTPDVSYDANPNTGFYVYDTYRAGGWYAVGGTSAGAPQWAALVAIANQGRALAGRASLDGSSQTIYALYAMAQGSYATYFHDVIGGGNGYYANPGYDLATGLGTPKASAVVHALVAASGSGTSISFAATAVASNITAATSKQTASPNAVAVIAPSQPPVAQASSPSQLIAAPAMLPATPAAPPASTPPPASTSALASSMAAITPPSTTQQSGGGDNAMSVDPYADTNMPPDGSTAPGNQAPIPDIPIVPEIIPPESAGFQDVTRQACDEVFVTEEWKAPVENRDTSPVENDTDLERPAMVAALALAFGWGSWIEEHERKAKDAASFEQKTR